MVTAEVRSLLCGLVVDRRNLVVAGPAGSGQTTLLSRLLGEVGNDRVVLIEDTPELVRTCRHAVGMTVVAPGPDGGGVDLEALVRQSLRMRPDRLVVGEVRGRKMDLPGTEGYEGLRNTVRLSGVDLPWLIDGRIGPTNRPPHGGVACLPGPVPPSPGPIPERGRRRSA